MSVGRSISESPLYATNRSSLSRRLLYDFRDYGFIVSTAVSDTFEVIPTTLDENEAFLFFISRDDVAAGRWALFNLHVFLKRKGPLEEFGHSLGESVKGLVFSTVSVFGKAGLGYSRNIAMKDLFKGAEQVIEFVGGQENQIVRDSHYYFMHRHTHCYTGVLHPAGADEQYDILRTVLFSGVKFLD